MLWINYNTQICESEERNFSLQELSCSVLYEEIAVKESTVLFWEMHYFRLMACMRIMRMSIPLSFTPDFLLREVEKTIRKNSFAQGIIHFIFFEKGDKVHFFISPLYVKSIPFWDNHPCVMEIFRDYKINADLLSTLSFLSDPKKRLADIYIREHALDEVVFLNQHNRLTQGSQGFLFILKDKCISTPKVEEGVQKSVLRGKFLSYLIKTNRYAVQEIELSSYELQGADEVFFLNDFSMRCVSHYRKKNYDITRSQEIFEELQLRVSSELL